MGRYLFNDQAWSIERDGTKLVITEPDGTSRTEQLADAAATTTRFTILTNQKLRAGWELERVVVEQIVPTPAAPHTYGNRNVELEAAIVADPDDREAWLIYGDWLQQRNDPRGELIARHAVQPWTDDAHRRAQVFFELHRTYFRNGLPDDAPALSITLQWGYASHLLVRGADSARLLKTVLTNDAARFLYRICVDTEQTEALAKAVKRIGRYAPATLRSLSFPRDGWIDGLAPLQSHLPRLRELELRVKLMGGYDQLVAHAFPELRSLSLVLGVGDLTFERALPWLASMPKLVELDLDFKTDRASVDAIISSRLGSQLEILGFERLGIAAAQHIVKRLPDLPKLRVLRVWGEIHPVPQAALAQAGVTAVSVQRFRWAEHQLH